MCVCTLPAVVHYRVPRTIYSDYRRSASSAFARALARRRSVKMGVDGIGAGQSVKMGVDGCVEEDSVKIGVDEER